MWRFVVLFFCLINSAYEMIVHWHTCEGENAIVGFMIEDCLPYQLNSALGKVVSSERMKWTGMLVVSLRGTHFGFWSRLGCLGKMSLFLAFKVSLRVARKEITKYKEF